jgi:hypothetical protein
VCICKCEKGEEVGERDEEKEKKEIKQKTE